MMPIKLSTIEVVKHYLLNDGTQLTVIAEQFDGAKARSFDAMMNAPMSIPTAGEIELKPKSFHFRAGVAAALALKDCSLLDEDGMKVLRPSQNNIMEFLDIWFHPALNDIVKIDKETGVEYSYCDLVSDAVYEANPQADPFPDREKAPTSGEGDES
jgi:hypothetical protein